MSQKLVNISRFSLEELRGIGTQDGMRSATPRDYTYDWDDNNERCEAYYFATYANSTVLDEVENRLHGLGYVWIEIKSSTNGKEVHLYVRNWN